MILEKIFKIIDHFWSELAHKYLGMEISKNELLKVTSMLVTNLGDEKCWSFCHLHTLSLGISAGHQVATNIQKISPTS